VDQRDIQAVSLGKFGLKNVLVPVEIFAVSNSGLVVPRGKKLEGKVSGQFLPCGPARDGVGLFF
jgi:hypothetical protein